jgi:hypothetical protein
MLAVAQRVETDFVKLVAGHYSLFHIYVIYMSLCLSLASHFFSKQNILFCSTIVYRFVGLTYFQVYLGKQEANKA